MKSRTGLGVEHSPHPTIAGRGHTNAGCSLPPSAFPQAFKS